MRATTFDPIHLGPPRHRRRNLFIAFGALVFALVAGAFALTARRAAPAKVEALEAFRAAYARTCDVPALAEPATPLMRDVYLRSPRLQATVAAQADALAAGAPCETVTRALRAADFPLPATERGEPTVTLEPGE